MLTGGGGERASRQAFLGVSALLFAASAAGTIGWCGSMSAMGGMPMPGGWTMSMAWMRMPGQTWSDAAASFLAKHGIRSIAVERLNVDQLAVGLHGFPFIRGHCPGWHQRRQSKSQIGPRGTRRRGHGR